MLGIGLHDTLPGTREGFLGWERPKAHICICCLLHKAGDGRKGPSSPPASSHFRCVNVSTKSPNYDTIRGQRCITGGNTAIGACYRGYLGQQRSFGQVPWKGFVSSKGHAERVPTRPPCRAHQNRKRIRATFWLQEPELPILHYCATNNACLISCRLGVDSPSYPSSPSSPSKPPTPFLLGDFGSSGIRLLSVRKLSE